MRLDFLETTEEEGQCRAAEIDGDWTNLCVLVGVHAGLLLGAGLVRQ